MESDDYHFKFKIALIGDTNVGKSTLIDSLTHNLGKVIENDSAGDLHVKSIRYADDANENILIYYEVPGRDHSLKYAHKYAMGATAAIFVFDGEALITVVTRRTTFQRIEGWINEIDKADIPVKLLVGNKVDQVDLKKQVLVGNPVSKMEAMSFARKLGMEYFESCAIEEASILQIFEHVFASCINLIPNPLDMRQLMGKNVGVGRFMMTDSRFKQDLLDLLPNYE